MESTPIAQLTYQLLFKLGRGRHSSSRATRTLTVPLDAILRPVLSNLIDPATIITAPVWGVPLKMRADHHLPQIVDANPFWSQSLVHAVAALAKPQVRVVDIGANIGDSVAMLEAALPGVCRFLCVEPDDEFFDLCTQNTRENPRTELRKCFIGDRDGAEVEIHHGVPGTATSRIVENGEGGAGGRRTMVTLDSVCADFARDGLDLVKIDTDGFDFKILRSGRQTLLTYKPLVYFEWDPKLWEAQGEDPLGVFEFLREVGYTRAAFFEDGGFFHSAVDLSASSTLRSLRDVSLARASIDNLYFDVLAGPADVLERASQLNLEGVRKAAREVRHWRRLGPAFRA